MKKIYSVFVAFFLICCASSDPYFYKDKKYSVTVYRFLYESDYNIPLDENTFWYIGKHESEFAIHNINGLDVKDMLDFLCSLDEAPPENVLNNTFWYHYAFVFPNKDTIYANSSLNEWKLRSKGKVYYYSGPNKSSSVADTLFYDFFTEHKFFSNLSHTKSPIKDK